MSEDGRNSIYLWLGTVTVFGAFWAFLHFDWFEGISDDWLWPAVTVLLVVNGVQTVWSFWQRHAANPENPDGL
jgi:hypothetical protein